MQYGRENNGARLDFHGINTVLPPDLMPPGKHPFAQNVRRYKQGEITGRTRLDSSVETLGAAVHSLRRLNDSTPAGPADGFILVGGAATDLYADGVIVDSGLSGNPISLVPFRPNTSVQPWMYVGDSNKMDKVRSDGTCYHMGIAEPQTAPTVIFIDSGTPGVNPITYRYTYRSSATGAVSNPSPESLEGANGANDVTNTLGASSGDITFDPSQWEVSSSQLRTTGSATSTPQLLGNVIAGNFGLVVPDKVTITGVEVTLNWQSQSTTGATLARVALFSNNVQLGVAKTPGTAPTGSATDATSGGNGDTWGAAGLTAAIVNDPSFGFAIQVSVQTVRIFLNSFTIKVFYENQEAEITAIASTDPQVDKIDYYRQGGGLNDFTYVGTGPNPPSGAFDDMLNALVVVANPLLQFDNYEPFPSIDLPRGGVVNIAAGAITGTLDVTWVSGDQFNIRWLPGTIIIIGGTAYTFYNRPASLTELTVILPDTVPASINGLTYEIPEPDLAAQPLPSLWGFTDNVNFFYGVGDPYRPGVLYWSKGNNPDAAPDTNQQDVTSPSEPLMNGCIVNGIGMVFSTERAWLIWPNFFNSLATVTGNAGSAWTLQEAITDRGLYIRSAIGVNGGKDVFFRGKDGIYVSPGGNGAKSITDEDLFNLFTHEGSIPEPVTIGGYTIYPPDDSQPSKQKINVANGYVYYDYVSSDNVPRTLVFDIAALGWVVDEYQYPATLHILEEGSGVNGTLVGCSNGTVRPLTNTGGEQADAIVLMPSFNASEARSQKHWGDVFIEASTDTQV